MRTGEEREKETEKRKTETAKGKKGAKLPLCLSLAHLLHPLLIPSIS